MDWIISPVGIVFSVIVIGYCIGQIKIRNISLDLSGVLIVAILLGKILINNSSTYDEKSIVTLQTNMKFLSSFGTSLFVSVIGITTGYTFHTKKQKSGISFFLGSLMVFVSYFTMVLMTKLNADLNHSKMIGILCGALTTTPGLSAACDLDIFRSEDIVLGYSSAYFFGVIFTVLFVQALSTKAQQISAFENKQPAPLHNKTKFDALLPMGLSILIGGILGEFQLFRTEISLGTTGGILCCGIGIGYILKKCKPEKYPLAESMEPFRNFGLVLFFAGNGISAGIGITENIRISSFAYTVLLSLLPLIVGWFISRLLFPQNKAAAVSIVAGGMTSTPALGILIRQDKEVCLTPYSLAYTGALLTMILLIRCLPVFL